MIDDVRTRTTDRIFQVCLGLLPFILIFFTISAYLFREVPEGLGEEARPYILALGFFGFLQMVMTLLLIAAFAQLSDTKALLPRLMLGVMIIMLFFPGVVIAMMRA